MKPKARDYPHIVAYVDALEKYIEELEEKLEKLGCDYCSET